MSPVQEQRFLYSLKYAQVLGGLGLGNRFRSVVLLCALFGSMPAQGGETIRLTNGEWPPYLSEHTYNNGFASDVVRQAFKAVDIEVEYGFFPWRRSYHYAKTGQGLEEEVWHGTIVWIYTDERAELFHYSDLVQEDRYVLFAKKENAGQYQSFEGLHGAIIGATAHTSYPVFEEAQSKGLLTIDRSGGMRIC